MPLLLLLCLLLPATTRAQDADSAAAAAAADSSAAAAKSDTPYATIIARNMFGLLPLPPPDTNPPAPPVDPPPKITPNGIMTIFGRDQALFKVAVKPKPGQPAKDESYVLAEGERQDDITVQKIDHVNGVITFDNHGTIQELPLVEAKDGGSSGGFGGGGGGGSSGSFLRPSAGGGQAANLYRPHPLGIGGTDGSGASYNNNGNGNPGMGYNPGNLSGASVGGYLGGGAATQAQKSSQPAPTVYTPEQQVILIEAQRMQYLQQNNPMANLLPPTPLTEENIKQNGSGQASAPPPMP